MNKKVITLVFAGILSMGMMAGCSSGSAPASSTSAQATQTVASSSAVDIAKITLADVEKANSYESILSRHMSFSFKYVLPEENRKMIAKFFRFILL